MIRTPAELVQNWAQFHSLGFTYFRGVIDCALVGELAEEANNSLTWAQRPDDGWREKFGSRVRETPAFQTTGRVARKLKVLQSAFLPLLRSVTGKFLSPTYAWYNHYYKTDGIWLHIDADESDVSLLTTIKGKVGPLHLHPKWRMYSQEKLDSLYLSEDWNSDCGTKVYYDIGDILINQGKYIPHHRPGTDIKSLCTVAALHYKFDF